MRKKLIIVEGEADKVVVKFLCRNLDVKIDIADGIGNVSNQMQDNTFVIGVVDNDKNKPKPKYFDNFFLCKTKSDTFWKSFISNGCKHHLLIINPAMEKWLLNAASKVGVNPENFNLPVDLKQFCSLTKTLSIRTNTDFQNFLDAIFDANAEPLITLQSWIKELVK